MMKYEIKKITFGCESYGNDVDFTMYMDDGSFRHMQIRGPRICTTVPLQQMWINDGEVYLDPKTNQWEYTRPYESAVFVNSQQCLDELNKTWTQKHNLLILDILIKVQALSTGNATIDKKHQSEVLNILLLSPYREIRKFVERCIE